MYKYKRKEAYLSQEDIFDTKFNYDFVVFDKDIIEDKSDYPCFGDTQTRPEGIEYVIVNGEIVVKGKEVLDKKPGKIIRDTLKKWTWEK